MPGDYRRPTKTTGLDWATLAPTCTSCGRRDSTVHVETGICATCTGPAPAPKPAKPARRSQRRTTERTNDAGDSDNVYAGGWVRQGGILRPRPQYEKPIGPRRRATGGPRDTTRPVDDAQVITDYQAGQTPPTIAKNLGVTPKRIRAILDRAGIDRRDDRAGHSRGRPRKYDDHTRAEVARLYLEGYSRRQVADVLGVPYKTVVTIMVRDGIQPREHQNGRRDGSAALRQRIRDLGVTPREINRWALDNGLIDLPKPGIASRVVVDAWEQAHTEPGRVAS